MGYQAYHLFELTTDDIKTIGEIVDSTRIEGVTSIERIRFWSSKIESVERAALKEAGGEAHMSARAMAEAADGTLDDLFEIKSNYPENPTYDRRRRNIEEALSLRSGIVRVSSTSIVFKKLKYTTPGTEPPAIFRRLFPAFFL